MLILKGVKVVCFDTLLQVLILKEMEKPSGGSGEWRVASGEKNLGAVAPVSRVFAYEWQGKDLRDKECVRVAGKGLTRHGVRKSGKQRAYKEAFLRFGARDEFRKEYTPVVTGSMRNGLRAQGIEAPRGAYDGESEEWRGNGSNGGTPIPGVCV